MTFEMNATCANELVKFAKTFVNPHHVFSNARVLTCSIYDNILTAEAADVTMWGKITLPLTSVNGDYADGEDFVIAPHTHRFRSNWRPVTVTAEETKTVYEMEGERYEYAFDIAEPKHWDKCVTKKLHPFMGFDAKKLAKALSVFDGVVKIDASAHDGMLIADDNTQAWVLPVRLEDNA